MFSLSYAGGRMATSGSEREVFWRELLARRSSLHLTVKEVCRQAGVSVASFFHWQSKLRSPQRQPRGRVAKPRKPSLPRALTPVRLVADRGAEVILELPHGVRVRVPPSSDAATFARLFRTVLTACREDAAC